MEVYYIPTEETVVDVYGVTTFTQGESIVIYNNSNNELYVSREPTEPALKFGVPLYQGKSMFISGESGKNIYVSGTRGNIVIQRPVDCVLQTSIVDFPADVWTSLNSKTRRLPVDEQQTSFEEGREFYCLADATIPAGGTKDYTFIFSTDTTFESSFLSVIEGDITLEVWAGGTDNGGFSTPIAVFPANSMSEAIPYPTGTTKFEGGVYNLDGTRVDYLRVKTDTNSNRSVGGEAEFLKKLGIPAGQYYFRFINNSGSSQAVFIIKERWEERSPSQFA